ncbi:hypothetical protein [Nocardia sp. Marseille-Q1738]
MICEALDFTLTQPRATLGAGIFAVIAAAIAFGGVLTNIGEQRKAERRKRRADLVLDAAAEWYTAGNRILAREFESPTERLQLSHQAHASLAKLELLGFEDAAKKANDTLSLVHRGVHDDRTDEDEFIDEFGESIEATLKAFRAAVKKAEHGK